MAYSGPVFDAGLGSIVVIEVTSGTEGATSDTGAIVGNYDGKKSAIVREHAGITKRGPIFISYDSFASSILAGEF